MAYILGFTAADGNVYKTTLAWDLKEDRELLDKINRVMGSTYQIQKCKASFRLRVSNPIIVNDIQALGISPNKSKTMRLPKVPPEFFSHFARGFLDGDGWIYIRGSRNEIAVGFSNGSYAFLREFISGLSQRLKLTTNNLRSRQKITKRGIRANTYQVDYSCENAYKILLYLYSNLATDDLFMERKYKKYQEAIKLYEWVKSGGRKWRQVEQESKQSLHVLLSRLWEAGYNGPQIARKLGVHSSSIYRWLIKTGVRPAFTEIRREGVI